MNPAGASCTIHHLLTEVLKLVGCIFSPDNCVKYTRCFFYIAQSMLVLGILTDSGAIFKKTSMVY